MDKSEAIQHLKKYLKNGTKVYSVLRHRNARRTYGVFDLYVVRKNVPILITSRAAIALGRKLDPKWEGIVAGDPYQLIHDLGGLMFPEGGVSTVTGTKETNGGYLLHHHVL
jgi:hypothetical protein